MFELNGTLYTTEELKTAALNYNMDFGTYLKMMKQKGLVEKQVDSAGDPTVSQDAMGSAWDDGSLVQRELPQVDVTASKEEDTWIERTLGKNIATDFFGDLWRAGGQGWAQGATVDEAFDIYKKGKDISDTDLQNFIDINNQLEKKGMSDDIKEYETIKINK